MSTKIQHNDAISTIGALSMVETHHNVYNLLEVREFYQHMPCFDPIHSDYHSWIGWHVRDAKIFKISKPNPTQDQANPGAVPLIFATLWLLMQNASIIKTFGKL